MTRGREVSGHLLMSAIVPMRPRRWAGSGLPEVRDEREVKTGAVHGCELCTEDRRRNGGDLSVCSVPTGYNRAQKADTA